MKVMFMSFPEVAEMAHDNFFTFLLLLSDVCNGKIFLMSIYLMLFSVPVFIRHQSITPPELQLLSDSTSFQALWFPCFVQCWSPFPAHTQCCPQCSSHPCVLSWDGFPGSSSQLHHWQQWLSATCHTALALFVTISSALLTFQVSL